MYDFLIVGCGLYGSVFANKCKAIGKKVLIIDQRNHIGGNCYTENIENINIHMYGPHIFHTNNIDIWNYVKNFASFNHYVNRPKVKYGQQLFSFPINLFTLYQLWGVNNPIDANIELEKRKKHIENPGNLEEWILSQVGEEIYEIFIKGYTTKQWNTDPKNLPADIIKRLPIRLTFDDNYFNDQYQGIPVGGYTAMIKNMIDGCDIALGENYFAQKDYWDQKAKMIVFTGRIDEFFNYRYGSLNYRSLRFDHTIHNVNDYQGNAIINYTETAIPYTRTIEHKHFEFITNNNKTVVTTEYPDTWDKDKTPYYPINTPENQYIYYKYQHLSKVNKNYIFGGRLAEYRYYDMHQVVGSALSKFDKLNLS